MRSEGYSTWSVCLSICLSVCLSVYNYSRTTGYEAAYEQYQQLQCYKGKKNNLAILLKRLRSRYMEAIYIMSTGLPSTYNSTVHAQMRIANALLRGDVSFFTS